MFKPSVNTIAIRNLGKLTVFKPSIKTVAFLFLGLTGFLFSSLSFAGDLPTIGAVAERLIAGTAVVTRILMVVCFAMGIGLVMMSVLTFKAHRSNPKFVPLDRPVLYFVLGIVLFCIPFLGNIFAPTGSVLELEKQKVQACPQDIDAPLGNEFGH